MTNNTTHDPSAHGRFERSRSERVIAGVAGGIAQRLEINAWWIRLGFIIFALVGAGILAYAALWIFLPNPEERYSAATRWFMELDLTDNGTLIGVILMGGAAVVIAFQVFEFSGWAVLAAIMFAAGIILFRGEPRVLPPEPDSILASADGSTDGGGVTEPDDDHESSGRDGDGPDDGEAAPAPFTATADRPVPQSQDPDGANVAHRTEAVRTSPPSYVGRLTIASVLIVLSGMGLLEASGIEVAGSENLFDPIHYAATALGIVGFGLLVSAFVGRARWLIAIGLLLVPVTILAAVVPSSFAWSFGEERYAPRSVDSIEEVYELGFGELTVDLTNLSEAELEAIGLVRLKLGAGEAVVKLPDDVGVRIIGEIGAGASDSHAGVGYGDYAGFGIDIDERIGPWPTVITVEGEVGFGVLTIEIEE